MPADSAGPTGFVYTGTWNTVADPAERWSDTPGDTAVASVDVAEGGSRVSLSGIMDPWWHGFAGVTVDDRPEVLVDLQRDPQINAVFFVTEALAPGRHTITVRVVGDGYGTHGHIVGLTGITVSNGTIVDSADVPTEPEPLAAPVITSTSTSADNKITLNADAYPGAAATGAYRWFERRTTTGPVAVTDVPTRTSGSLSTTNPDYYYSLEVVLADGRVTPRSAEVHASSIPGTTEPPPPTNEPPVAGFTYTLDAAVDTDDVHQVTYVNASTGHTGSPAWTFGQGTPGTSTAETVTVSYPASTTAYTVSTTLTVSDETMSDDEVKTISLPAASAPPTGPTEPTPTGFDAYVAFKPAQIASLSTTSPAALRAKDVADKIKSGAYVAGTGDAGDIKQTNTRVGSIALTAVLWVLRTGDLSYLPTLKAYLRGCFKPATTVQALNHYRAYPGLLSAIKLLKVAGHWTASDDAAPLPNHGGISLTTFLNGGSGLESFFYRQHETAGGRWSRLRAPSGVAANEGCVDDSASNWGEAARAAHLAGAVLAENQAELDHAIKRRKKFLGDTTTGLPDFMSSNAYKPGWGSAFPGNGTGSGSGQVIKAGIGARNANAPGLDGVVLNDIDRGGTDYSATATHWGATGSGLTYPLEAADYTWLSAAILLNGGHDVRAWGDAGLVRMNDRFDRVAPGGQTQHQYAEAQYSIYNNGLWIASAVSNKDYGLTEAKASAGATSGLPRALPFGDWIAGPGSTWLR